MKKLCIIIIILILAGVVLILENIKDRKYWIRLNSTIEFYKLPITTWKIENF